MRLKKLFEHPSRGYKLREFFKVLITARSTPQGGINFKYPPEADVKDGCPFLAPSFGQTKEGGYKVGMEKE
jgi:hypothetical protein